jgi:hypothetical protein
MQKLLRSLLLLVGTANLLFAVGFFTRMSWAITLWPWPEGRLTYIFIASILAAIGAAVLWIAVAREWAALAPGSLNLLIMLGGIGGFLFSLSAQAEWSYLRPFAVAFALLAVFNLLLFLAAWRYSPPEPQPTPWPVLVSFILFTAVLIWVGISLIRQTPGIMPWPLSPESSVIIGWIFFGDAFYFLYALLRPSWPFSRAQLWSFLAYDLVLIGPLVAHIRTVPPELLDNLLIYIAILIYSGGLAIYYLFLNRATRVLL